MSIISSYFLSCICLFLLFFIIIKSFLNKLFHMFWYFRISTSNSCVLLSGSPMAIASAQNTAMQQSALSIKSPLLSFTLQSHIVPKWQTLGLILAQLSRAKRRLLACPNRRKNCPFSFAHVRHPFQDNDVSHFDFTAPFFDFFNNKRNNRT